MINNKKLLKKLLVLNLCILGSLIFTSLISWENLFSGKIWFIVLCLACASVLYVLLFLANKIINKPIPPKQIHSQD